MNFKLTYQGVPGEVQATLKADGETIATEYGLSSEKDARKWAKAEAQAYKNAAILPDSQQHNVYTSIAGHKAFSL